MRTLSADELKEVLRLHQLWAIGRGGKRADFAYTNISNADLRGAHLCRAYLNWSNLSCADLSGANLAGASLAGTNLSLADLSRANLVGADLREADLRGANLNRARLDTGETFEQYLSEVVPALLTAGGKTVEEVTGAWGCHLPDNCPMAVAFSVDHTDHCPLLFQPRVRQFIQLFDAGLIPCPKVSETEPPGMCCHCKAKIESSEFSDRKGRWYCSATCVRQEATFARINGEWDNPALVAYGPLAPTVNEDIEHILSSPIPARGLLGLRPESSPIPLKG